MNTESSINKEEGKKSKGDKPSKMKPVTTAAMQKQDK
jgi:hypothetical protein